MVLSVQFRFEYKHDWLVGDSFVRYFGFKMGFFEKMIGTILLNDVKYLAHHFLHNQKSLVYFHLSVSWQSLGQRNYMVLPNGYLGSSSWLPKRPFRDFVNGTNFSSNCRCKRYSPTYVLIVNMSRHKNLFAKSIFREMFWKKKGSV